MDFTITFPGIETHCFTVSSPWGMSQCMFCIHTVSSSIPPGTDYCWVARIGVDSKLAFKLPLVIGIKPSTPRSRVLCVNHSGCVDTYYACLICYVSEYYTAQSRRLLRSSVGY